MEITSEQLKKLFELAGIDAGSIESYNDVDISKALVAIERKLNFFDTNISFALNQSNKNVLIVDDLELSIYQLNQLLKKIGITPSVARNKAEAVAEMMKKSFNYVLIDLFLPDYKDGLELIQKAVSLKEMHEQDFHILVMSGTDDKSLIDECYKQGIDAYIPKSDMWHTEILKYISATSQNNGNSDFSKYVINNNIVSYVVRRFNGKKVFDDIIADINSSVLAGQQNIIINLEQVNLFDVDNAYVFAEIYRLCAVQKGVFALINPSERIREALSFAYLDGIIPLFSSLDAAVEYIDKKSSNK